MIKLLLIAAICLPPQFDTSSQLLLPGTDAATRFARKFVTWDTVYYLSQAQRGIWFEHEFAFSPIWASIIGFVSPFNSLTSLAITSVLLSLVASYVAGKLLYKNAFIGGLTEAQAHLAREMWDLSPAGAFLIAGYPEATFACLSFLGVGYFYKRHYVKSGLVLGACCLLRSNGLLWGLLFAHRFLRAPSVGVFIGGFILGVLFLVPHARLWWQLCPGAEWCSNTVPLGYTYIQSKYWNNGFLHYWTPNNIPNFLFALPTLVLLVVSLPGQPPELQLVQATYLVLAILFWHVQIINRVGSCLPGIYWYLARHDQKRLLTVWALVQCVLFGAFLPPA